jgi:hypothetical protein
MSGDPVAGDIAVVLVVVQDDLQTFEHVFDVNQTFLGMNSRDLPTSSKHLGMARK